MRILHVILLLNALASGTVGNKVCGHIDRQIELGEDPKTIQIEVCPGDVSSSFHYWTKPIRSIIDKWLGRRHLSADEINDLKEKPWFITNIPTYANYTAPDPAKDVKGGWTAHVHGDLYKRREMSQKEIDHLVNRILIRASVTKEKFMYKMWFDKLSPTEKQQSRHQVRDLATAAIRNGAIEAHICNQTIVLPTLTNEEGAFKNWLPLTDTCDITADDPFALRLLNKTFSEIYSANLSLSPLNVAGGPLEDSRHIQRTFFVPPRGLTIVSDVDDVLRVGEIWNWKQAILDLYARPYVPWLGMADVYRNWSRNIPHGREGRWKEGQWVEGEAQHEEGIGRNMMTNVHFHYATDSPEVNAGFYIDGTKANYPPGSFDFRPLNYTRFQDLANARIANVKRLLETFPERKFILVSDTTSKSSMEWFPELALKHPNQIQCILMRDVQVTEASDYIIPATRHFLKIPANKYLFFRTPSGWKTPTLTNLSTSYLTSVAALQPSKLSDDHFPPYIDNLNEGCFPMYDAVPQSKWPNKSIGTRLKTTLNLAWFKLKCMFIPRWRRPNHACPFDRRPGTVYWDKRVEPNHDW